MAILKFKKLLEDLENNTTTVLGSVTKVTSSATLATSAGYAGTSYLTSSANYAGTSRVAHYASSGTAAIAGTSVVWSTGGL
jgi:hypothetical protein